LLPDGIEEPFKSIIEKGWSVEPGDRPSFDEIFKQLSLKSSGIRSVKAYVEEIRNEPLLTQDVVLVDDQLEEPFPSLSALTEPLWAFHKDLKRQDDLRENFAFQLIKNQIQFFAEVRALLSLKHPCIIGFVGFSFPTFTDPATVITERAQQSLEENRHALSDTLIENNRNF
jgi:hypothetical protein